MRVAGSGIALSTIDSGAAGSEPSAKVRAVHFPGARKGSETSRSRGPSPLIAASQAGERYRLLRGDQLVAEAVGDGGRVELPTGPLDATTELQLALVRTEPGALPVERRIRLIIAVQP